MDYSNKHPKTLASVAIINHGGKLLMILREKGEFSGYWETPGGHIEQGETPEEAVVREVKEEAGVDVRITKFLGIIENNNSVCNYFDCELLLPGQIEGNSQIKLVSIKNLSKYAITPFALENLIKLGFCKKY
jgi:mutator protein MutT